MSDEAVLARLTRILRDLLGEESITLTRRTRRPDVPGWDSFTYVNFIVAVEMEYGIKFRVADVEAFDTVGEIVAEIGALRRQAGAA
jgi:acyl carrier protein